MGCVLAPPSPETVCVVCGAEANAEHPVRIWKPWFARQQTFREGRSTVVGLNPAAANRLCNEPGPPTSAGTNNMEDFSKVELPGNPRRPRGEPTKSAIFTICSFHGRAWSLYHVASKDGGLTV